MNIGREWEGKIVKGGKGRPGREITERDKVEGNGGMECMRKMIEE